MVASWFKCLPAIMAILFHTFSGLLCCCASGQMFGRSTCESEQTSSPKHAHSHCGHSHSHSHAKCLEVSTNQQQSAPCHPSQECDCTNQQGDVLLGVASKSEITPVWIAPLHSLSLIAMAPLDSKTAVRVVRSDPPIPPGCPLFIVHSTFLV
jgi:hypothetical protein